MAKNDDGKIRMLLKETILSLVRGCVHFETDLRIDAVIGITVDCDRVIMVSLHHKEKPQTVKHFDLALSETVQSSSHNRNSESSRHHVHKGSAAKTGKVKKTPLSKDTLNYSTSLSMQPFVLLQSSEETSQTDGDHNNIQLTNLNNSFFDSSNQMLKSDDENGSEMDDDLTEQESDESLSDNLEQSSSSTTPAKVKLELSEQDVLNNHSDSVNSNSNSSKPVTLSFEQRIEAIHMYEKWKNAHKIAKHFGVSETQIRNIIRNRQALLAEANRGTTNMPWIRRSRNQLTLEERVKAIHMHDVMKSTKKVAAHFGVGATQIRAILKRRREFMAQAGEDPDDMGLG